MVFEDGGAFGKGAGGLKPAGEIFEASGRVGGLGKGGLQVLKDVWGEPPFQTGQEFGYVIRGAIVSSFWVHGGARGEGSGDGRDTLLFSILPIAFSL